MDLDHQGILPQDPLEGVVQATLILIATPLQLMSCLTMVVAKDTAIHAANKTVIKVTIMIPRKDHNHRLM